MDHLIDLPIELLQPGCFQPRRHFEPHALAELAQSIQEHGIIEPLIVRLLNNPNSTTTTPARYEIIAGERRWRAAQQIPLHQVPCIIRPYTHLQAAAVALIENVQREDLNPIEEAHALSRLLAEFNYTQSDVATAVGKSRTKITNCLRLLSLDHHVQQYLIEKKITEGHGKILAVLAHTEQYRLATDCIAKSWSVRRLEQEVKKIKSQSILSKISNTLDNPDIASLEKNISEILNTVVKLESSTTEKNSGWLKIKYYDHDTLIGILRKIGIEDLENAE